MSDSNLLQEIEEDLQRQRYEALWKRYGIYVISAMLAIVLATAAYTTWQSYTLKSQQKATYALLSITKSKDKDQEKQLAALDEYAKTETLVNQQVLAQLKAAALAIKNSKMEQALGLYENVATNAKAEAVFRQLADLLWVQAQLDHADPAILQSRLQPLLTNSAWRYSAKEYSAHLALKTGDKAKAKQLFTELAQEAAVPQSIGERSRDMATWLGEGS